MGVSLKHIPLLQKSGLTKIITILPIMYMLACLIYDGGNVRMDTLLISRLFEIE